ncbi:MAG: hypothetical protein WDO70_02735 [Alphaproteobacteria bacterium]
MSLARIKKMPVSYHADRLDDFEERIMFGDLGELLTEIEDDRNLSEELVHGIESLKYFRDFYHEKRQRLSGEDRTRLAAYDAAWCLELIDLAQREKAGRYYRA